MRDRDNLVWIDLEMTGLDPREHRILEIGTLVTNASLDVIAEGPELVVHESDSVLATMNDWSREHHQASGLVDRVRASTVSVEEAEQRTLAFVKEHCEEGQAPLAGNSIHMDRFFLKFHMPALEAYLHYRNVDVTTLKELARRWNPQVLDQAPRKADAHRAMEDLRDSIAELRHYRVHLIRLPASGES
jgi:oligoribonuclease